MSFEYYKYFGADAYTGYEVLLYDCMIGDATLFQRADMVEAGWTVVDPVLDVWKGAATSQISELCCRCLWAKRIRRTATGRRT